MSVARARGVTRRFGTIVALDRVDLEVARGKVVAVLGPSGSGKSTLLRLLALVDEPTSGAVELFDEAAPRRGRTRLGLQRRIGLVQQTPGLLRSSARDNVAFPLRARGVARREAGSAAGALLDELGLGPRADASASTLSGGEAQRVALARALVADPALLLVDEGTNQLDPGTARLAERVVLERARGAAVVWVTHSVSQARRVADRVLYLEGGRATGPVEARAFFDGPPPEARMYLADA